MEENTVTKMPVKEAAELRANLYEIAINAFNAHGMTGVPIKGGNLLTIRDGVHAKVSISIVDEGKVDKYLTEYAEQQDKNAARAADRAAKAEEKAQKAAERAAAREAKKAKTE